MFMGVCAGLAAYFRVDVTLVRILFVIASFATSGVAILLYMVMTVVVPEANTSEEHAAAYGLPFNARELVDQATKKADFATRRWRREWRRKQRGWKREWRTAMDEPRWRADYIPGAVFAGIMSPIFGIINFAMFVFLAWVIYSLSTTGSVSGWTIPPEMPFWVAVMIVIGLYLVITSPLSAARHVSHRAYRHYPSFAVISGIIWLGVVAFLIYLGSQHVSEIREFVETLPAVWNELRMRLQNRP
jgi:phage shock protein PspC (stress-responsive transcriptional regulator)